MTLKQAVERIKEEQIAYDKWEERNWRQRAVWELTFSWLPRRCAISRRWIWLKKAQRGEYIMVADQVEVVSVFTWHHSQEHLIWLLRG